MAPCRRAVWEVCFLSSSFESAFNATPEKVFLRLGLTPTLIRHENGSFLKRHGLQTVEIWKRRILVFVCTENILR